MRQIIRTIYCTDKSIIVLSLLVLSVFCCVYKLLYQNKKINNKIVGVAFVFCLLATLCPTIIQRIGGANTRELLLTPFRSLTMYYSTGYEEWIRLCLMNVALFYPLGSAYACFNKHKKFKPWMFVLFSFLLSLIIEVVQYIFSLGCSETDDVINNTVGAILGYLITMLFFKALEKITKEE